VLQVLPALVTGGVERGTIEVASALVRAGWNAIVASAGGPMVYELERAGARHVSLPLDTKNPFSIRRNATRLAELIEAAEIDLVHARSRAPAWSALWASERTHRPFVTTFHNVYGGGSTLKHRYNAVMAKGTRVIAISDFVATHAMEAYGVGPDRLRVIPRGVDLQRFDPKVVTPTRVIALAKAWGVDPGLPVIVLPGRITRWKGHTELIEAIQRLGRRDVQVLFVGNDAQKPAFRRELLTRIDGLGLEGVFHFVGDCRDMPAGFMLADVVVSASIEPEGFGRVAVEAQAMGRPLIATDHGGSRETVIHRETGWLVPPRDPAAMADAIAAALSLSEAERMDLATRARTWIASRFDTKFMTDATLRVYEEVVFGMHGG
jgi:glycosyltransferase involved in cell wall biosynthesis